MDAKWIQQTILAQVQAKITIGPSNPQLFGHVLFGRCAYNVDPLPKMDPLALPAANNSMKPLDGKNLTPNTVYWHHQMSHACCSVLAVNVLMLILAEERARRQRSVGA